jgi:hypothetical protein
MDAIEQPTVIIDCLSLLTVLSVRLIRETVWLELKVRTGNISECVLD